MAKKTKTQKARKVPRATGKAAQVQSKRTHNFDDGLGKVIDSIQRRYEQENVKQAALRIVKEAAEHK